MGKPNIEKTKAKGDVKGLIKALKNKDGDIRSLAVVALGWIQDARVIEPLAQALRDGNVYVQEAAQEASGKIRAKKGDSL